MIINDSSHSKFAFGNKYPTKTILAIASKKDIRKADAVNFINSITKLNKEEQKAILRIDNKAFLKHLQNVAEHLMSQIPGLKKLVLQLENTSSKKDEIYKKAILLYGDEIDVKRLINPRICKKAG